MKLEYPDVDEERRVCEILEEENNEGDIFPDYIEYDDYGVDTDEDEFDSMEFSKNYTAIDPKLWKEECEKVYPKLNQRMAQSKIIRSEWSNRLEDWRINNEIIKKNKPNCSEVLDKLLSNVRSELDQIEQKENTLSISLQKQCEMYNEIMKSTKEKQELVVTLQSEIDEVSSQYNSMKERVKSMKDEIDSRFKTGSDAVPIVKIKQAMKQLQQENEKMDIQLTYYFCYFYNLLASRLLC